MLTKPIKRPAILYGAVALLLSTAIFIYCAIAAPNVFTATVPANTEVTMGDADAIIPVTISNSVTSNTIRSITFNIDTAKYNISSFTTPPSGWCISSVTTGSITFALRQNNLSCGTSANGTEIAAGASLLFNIKALPISAASDVAGDSFTSITVSGFSTGALPTWTRRSIAATMEASPSSAATNGAITLSMQVTNRSTATQSGITTNPSPPSPSAGIVINTAGPYYGSTVLAASIDSSSTTITVSSTSDFPSTGTIVIDSEEICYTGKTATTFTGATRGCNATTATSHTSGAITYNKTAFSLAPGASGTMIWLYQANSTGSVYFTARGRDSTNTATSVNTSSNTVTVGAFTSTLAVSPTSLTTGQNVTVQMVVSNNGTGTLINTVPTALTPCAGGATETLVSGPTPAFMANLTPGGSGTFQWTYQITGTAGQPYCLSGGATADGPVTTNTATSNTGAVATYSATVSPQTVASGSTNVTLTWAVYNGGTDSVRRVDIQTPASGGNWTCSSVTPPANWSASCGSTVQFTADAASRDIPVNGTKSFSITFSTTETVTAQKTVTFPLTILGRANGSSAGAVNTTVTVTTNALTLTHSPAGPIDADGSTRYAVTAVLTSGGQFASGKIVNFTTTNGSLETASAVTDANGQATVYLISPYSTSNTSATVTATYLGITKTDTVSFNGWTKPNILYWGVVTPTSVNCGDKVSFDVTVKNVATTSMTLTSNSYFAFNDSTAGGCSVYKAFLDSGYTGVIAAGTTKVLRFGSETNAGAGGGVTVPASFISGAYTPVANSTPPPESGMFLTEVVPPNPGPGTNDQYRTVTDSVSPTGAACYSVRINILEWRELR